MGHLEEFLKNCTKPVMYLKFIDDIIISTKNLQRKSILITNSNRYHQRTTFSVHHGKTKILF